MVVASQGWYFPSPAAARHQAVGQLGALSAQSTSAVVSAAKSAKIGFVGWVHMGGNMAARFLGEGYEVFGEERSGAGEQAPLSRSDWQRS